MPLALCHISSVSYCTERALEPGTEQSQRHTLFDGHRWTQNLIELLPRILCCAALWQMGVMALPGAGTQSSSGHKKKKKKTKLDKLYC